MLRKFTLQIDEELHKIAIDINDKVGLVNYYTPKQALEKLSLLLNHLIHSRINNTKKRYFIQLIIVLIIMITCLMLLIIIII